MNAEHLRKLKHELRTPVNHIVGYSELLFESADEASDVEVSVLAKSLQANGQLLARLLERTLLSPGNEIDEEQISALRDSLRPVIERIVKDSSSLVVSATAEYETDLARIRHAANQLMALMGEMKIASAE
jgi:light-regulated signal transduction histidine kinase (bacteriophytochrome)